MEREQVSEALSLECPDVNNDFGDGQVGLQAGGKR